MFKLINKQDEIRPSDWTDEIPVKIFVSLGFIRGHFLILTIHEFHDAVNHMILYFYIQVCTHSKCEMAVFPHAVKLLDRFLSNTPCREENLQVCTHLQIPKSLLIAGFEPGNSRVNHFQAVGGACVLLASKFRETTPLGIKRVCQLTQGAVSEDMIKVINPEPPIFSILKPNFEKNPILKKKPNFEKNPILKNPILKNHTF